MAEYAASTSYVKLHSWSSSVKEKANFIGNTQFRTPQRNYLHRSCEVFHFPPLKPSSLLFSNFKASPFARKTPSRCSSLGSLVDPDGATASDLVSISNQLLLMTSIALTYMAGVVPLKRSNFTSLRNVLDDNDVDSGSAKKTEEQINIRCPWDVVKEKLSDSLDAIERKSNLGNGVLEIDQQLPKRPLSLYAVSEGPKLRLLWASVKQLEDEVNNILGDCEVSNLDDWLSIFPEIIQKCYNCISEGWLLEELRLENKKQDKAFVSLITEKLKGDETVLRNIRKAGKEDLYAELLYFVRFGSPRKNCCYDRGLFTLHGDSILEDLVITLADGIASVYLELISVDGKLSDELNDLGMDMCNLSTRALQRLRNEVTLNQWIYQNLEAVISMYEDRFDLCTLQSKVAEEPCQIQAENSSWWKKLTWRKPGTITSSMHYTVISPFSMPVKRTKELRALTGWRYYFSLYLELSDITIPLIKILIEKVSNAISFFLVSLIGRSLGLIYTGIRQSLRWK
ncbi:uncharacterized protein [Euphorbia lathyris]|uniref:uncharacterized protein n=1 Tax=Euphorbia lathyris TaxID=212925 RepID=UPI00331358BD